MPPVDVDLFQFAARPSNSRAATPAAPNHSAKSARRAGPYVRRNRRQTSRRASRSSRSAPAPIHWSGRTERDSGPPPWPLAQVGVEEGESRAKPGARRGSHALHDLLGEFVAREAAAVERIPDRCPDSFDLLGGERRVQRARGIAPRWKPLVGRTTGCAPRRVPECQLAGGMEVQRAAERPGLDERPLLPERRPDVGLPQAVEPRRQLQLGRRLQLCLRTAQRAHDLDEPSGARADRSATSAPAGARAPRPSFPRA